MGESRIKMRENYSNCGQKENRNWEDDRRSSQKM
jgi:hypothetical protein